MTYNASSARKQTDIAAALFEQSYKVTSGQMRAVYNHTVRVWRAETDHEKSVIDPILAVDPAAKELWPKPSFEQG